PLPKPLSLEKFCSLLALAKPSEETSAQTFRSDAERGLNILKVQRKIRVLKPLFLQGSQCVGRLCRLVRAAFPKGSNWRERFGEGFFKFVEFTLDEENRGLSSLSTVNR
ncbi:hypothetical protein, partial [Trichormus variabilis]|uniref:hypothetical protein n=1 Tax=Anabaena variabilis TaxID=264691 RepID=UPI001A93894E